MQCARLTYRYGWPDTEEEAERAHIGTDESEAVPAVDHKESLLEPRLSSAGRGLKDMHQRTGRALVERFIA
jgi:hypothetical protein